MPVSPALVRPQGPAEDPSKDPVADIEKTLTTVWEPSGTSILGFAQSVADLAVRLDAQSGNDHRQAEPREVPAHEKGEHHGRGHRDGGTHAAHAGPKPAVVPVAKPVTGHDEHAGPVPAGPVLASPALTAVPGGDLTGTELLTWAGGYIDQLIGDLHDFMDHVLDKAETAARTPQPGSLSLVSKGPSR